MNKTGLLAARQTGHGPYIKTCIQCGKEFVSKDRRTKTCSEECNKLYKRECARKWRQETADKKLSEGIEGIDYVVCPICGYKAKQMSVQHFENLHGMSKDDVMAQYPDFKWMCQSLVDNVSGDKNPRSAKNMSLLERQRTSPYSPEFYIARGYSKEDAVKMAHDKVIEKNSEKEYTMRTDYYTKRGYTEDEAKEMVKDRARTNTIETYIKKYGEEEGPQKWRERNDEWAKKMFAEGTCMSTGTSNMANEFISEVVGSATDGISSAIHNKEKFIYDHARHRAYSYDLYNEHTKKIIEFNGDFWHANPKLYSMDFYNAVKKMSALDIWSDDEYKTKLAQKHGYEVMVVWEYDFKHDHERIINEAKNFLYS